MQHPCTSGIVWQQFITARLAGTYSPAPTERVQTIHAWVQHLIASRIVAGGMKQISSSVQSRIHTALTAAMLGYEQCKYVSISVSTGWAMFGCKPGMYSILLELLGQCEWVVTAPSREGW
jgi:hypothetical protein